MHHKGRTVHSIFQIHISRNTKCADMPGFPRPGHILTGNNHCLPIADTGDCTDGVTVTVIGVLDDPPIILTITSINPDDSEPVNCPDVNSTTNTTI